MTVALRFSNFAKLLLTLLEPPTLLSICRNTIRNQLGELRFNQIGDLQIPVSLQGFIQGKEEYYQSRAKPDLFCLICFVVIFY